VQVAVEPDPARTQVDEKDPGLSVPKPTLPVGVTVVPGEVSVTVAVQELPWLTTTGVAQARVMLVVRRLTVMLAAWLVLPE
jgi:hypothetical protein